MDINRKEIERASKLADDILTTVMNAEMDFPEGAFSALAHVASLIALELKMPEKEFAYCMTQSYRAASTTGKFEGIH